MPSPTPIRSNPLYAAMLVAAVLLAGCADPQGEAPIEERPAAVTADEAIAIPVTDELGSFASEVAGIALWAHPALAYEGGVLAANGTAGLIFIDFEKASPDTVPGTFESPLAVTYPAWQTPGASLIAAYETASGYRFFDIEPEARLFEEWAVTGADALPADPLALCLVSGEQSGMVTLAVITQESGLSLSTISENEDGSLAVSEPARVNVPGVMACAGDDGGQQLLLATRNGRLLTLSTGAETDAPAAAEFAILPEITVKGLAVSLQQDQGQLLVATGGEETLIYGYDLASGERFGAFSIDALDEIETVAGLSVFGADGGNFGGIYRKGVIATIGSGEARRLKLAPLSAALRQWDLFEADVLNRRDMVADERERDPFEPQIELTLPEL